MSAGHVFVACVVVALAVLPHPVPARDLVFYSERDQHPALIGSEELLATYHVRTVMEEEPQDALCDVNVRMRKEPNGQWVYGNTSCDPGDEYGWVHIDILAEGDFRFEGAGCQVDADPPEFYPDCYKLPSFPEDDGIEVKCVMCTEDAPLPIELKEW